MRIASSVTSVSWIPSGAIPDGTGLPFALAIHHDEPLPDVVEDLGALRDAGGFRFANVLSAWIEVEDGAVVGCGYDGNGMIGDATAESPVTGLGFPAVAYPDLQQDPELGDGWVRFVQTAGGRTGAPMPRGIDRPPHLQLSAPTAWTTLGLTLHVDGRVAFDLAGASPFPRHWIYDADGRLAFEAGFVDFRTWAMANFGDRSPWGDHDEEPALVARVGAALERQLSAVLRDGAGPAVRTAPAGALVAEQGAPAGGLLALLEGVLAVEVDGEAVAEVGTGAVLAEEAVPGAGVRGSTLRAVTPVRLAVAGAEQLDRPGPVERIVLPEPEEAAPA